MSIIFLYILCLERPAIVSEGAFSHHATDCPLDSLILLSANQGRRLSRHSFVTFVESNAKALLTGSLSKMQTCKQVLRPAGGELSTGQLIVLRTEAAVSAALLPPFIRLLFNSATIQSLYLLQPCKSKVRKFHILCIVALFSIPV